MEVPGVAAGLPVPFPEPGADAANPSVGGRTLVPCLELDWVGLTGLEGRWMRPMLMVEMLERDFWSCSWVPVRVGSLIV